jgi:RNA-directed DNA polymerase
MIKTPNEFERIIGFSIAQIEEVLDNADKYYYSFSEIKKDENGLPKIKNGVVQERRFDPAKGDLKLMQDRLQKRILSKVPLIDSIVGGVKGKSNIENAARHRGKKYRFQTDIQKCFPSISSRMVFNSLRAKGFSKPVADIITRIVTYRTRDSVRNNCLPQGIHTSTTMANIVMEKVALKVLEYTKGRNITLSIWVDDWTLSSDRDFRELVPGIIKILSQSGFKVAHGKTTYREGKSVITGVVVGMSTMKETDTFRTKGMKTLTREQLKGRENYRKNLYTYRRREAQ